MLADPINFREVDLSHLSQAPLAELTAEVLPSSTSGYLLLALFISIVLHSLLFLWQMDKPAIFTPASQIHINLNKVYVAPQEQPKASEPKDEPFTTRNNEQVVTPALTIPAPRIPNETRARREEKPKIVTSLSRDEMQEIIEQRNGDNAMPKPDSISRNVFNPALRQRLMDEENKPDIRRADAGPKTHMDPSGATIVDLGGGKCLRSTAFTRVGEAQNWYMTSCGGKSESEGMMERINERVNGKLRFDE